MKFKTANAILDANQNTRFWLLNVFLMLHSNFVKIDQLAVGVYKNVSTSRCWHRLCYMQRRTPLLTFVNTAFVSLEQCFKLNQHWTINNRHEHTIVKFKKATAIIVDVVPNFRFWLFQQSTFHINLVQGFKFIQNWSVNGRITPHLIKSNTVWTVILNAVFDI
jgi:hypothetical protein